METGLWKTERETAGREARRNICDARAKVQPGFHPQSKKEAFDVFMNNITQFVLLYTNQEGRRIAAEKQTEWKRFTEEELQAFLGLHLLSGKTV